MLPVTVRREVLEIMRDHALRAYPLECCGLLSGRGSVIDRATETANLRKSPTAFAVAPAELIAFFKDLRRRSERFLGIYHSHPAAAAVPSPRDVAEFHYPEASYWIVGAGLEVRCYGWRGETFEPRAYRVTQ